MTHKAADCMERPRKIGAKYSGKDIAADELVQDITTTWDSKRDRWNGYDAAEYIRVVKKFEAEERKKREDGEVDDEDSDKEEQKEGEKEKVRSLRERGDKAAYLEDLSEDAAVFNPKSRTLRTESGVINEKGQFQKELSENALEYDNLRKMAEEISEKGEGIHMEASPTEGILRLKQLQQEKEKQHTKLKQSLLEKYGGAEHLAPRPKEIEVTPIEAKVINNPTISNSVSSKSKYPEDIYPGNHTSVWGSYWKNGKWGFDCCHSLIKQSYCLGVKGIEINDKEKKEEVAIAEHSDQPPKRTYNEVS